MALRAGRSSGLGAPIFYRLWGELRSMGKWRVTRELFSVAIAQGRTPEPMWTSALPVQTWHSAQGAALCWERRYFIGSGESSAMRTNAASPARASCHVECAGTFAGADVDIGAPSTEAQRGAACMVFFTPASCSHCPSAIAWLHCTGLPSRGFVRCSASHSPDALHPGCSGHGIRAARPCLCAPDAH